MQIHFYPRPTIRSILLTICGLFLSGYFTPAVAESRYAHFNNNPLDFSLSLMNYNQDFKVDTSEYPIHQSRISISLFDKTYPDIQLGLLIGNSYLSINDDMATAGLNLNGYHIGFAIRKSFGNNPHLGLYAHYLYQEGRDKNYLHSATLTWHEWLTEASIQLNLGSRWGITLAGGPTGLNVERRVSGDINETLRMDPIKAFEGRMEFEMMVPANGRISLALHRGAFSGATLNFGRIF